MADDIFQNQVCLDDSTYDSYLDLAMTFDLATNTMVDQPFDANSNDFWLDAIAWDYFDGQMALNTVVDGLISNDTSGSREHVWPGSMPCESYLDDLVKPNTVGGNTFYVHNQAPPDHITFDSYVDDGPLMVNLTTNTIRDDIIDTDHIVCDCNPDEPATREF